MRKLTETDVAHHALLIKVATQEDMDNLLTLLLMAAWPQSEVQNQ